MLQQLGRPPRYATDRDGRETLMDGVGGYQEVPGTTAEHGLSPGVVASHGVVGGNRERRRTATVLHSTSQSAHPVE